MESHWGKDPLATARDDAARAGKCPISYVDELASNHWDCWEICSWFSCKECVAAPEDFGWVDPKADGACSL